jgi:hypothetical protein
VEISVKDLAGLEKLTDPANFHLWKDEMMTFSSIYGLESFVKGSDTQPYSSAANRKDIESWDKKIKNPEIHSISYSRLIYKTYSL